MPTKYKVRRILCYIGWHSWQYFARRQQVWRQCRVCPHRQDAYWHANTMELEWMKGVK